LPTAIIGLFVVFAVFAPLLAQYAQRESPCHRSSRRRSLSPMAALRISWAPMRWAVTC
jgi:hypothetical protein